MQHFISPIGFLRSPFKEKFAIPRQATLAPSVQASIQLVKAANHPDTVRGLEQFSHLWLLFLFEQNLAKGWSAEKGWSATVRPPRLGGNKRIGVFASRATFRPNGIGMSAVALQSVCHTKGQVRINIGCCDLLDGTPIIDIKPYIPYSDAIIDAVGGFAAHKPETLDVEFSTRAASFLQLQKDSAYKKQVICEVLAQDPRPAYKKAKQDVKEYAVHLFDLNIKFMVTESKMLIHEIEPIAL